MHKEEFGNHNKEFMYLSQQDITKIQEVSMTRSYKKGQVLFYEGDARANLYFLISGILRLERNDYTGRFSYLHFEKPKVLVPKIGMFLDKTYNISAIAHTDIKITSIPTKIYEEILTYNNKQLIALIQEQSEIMKSQILKIQKSTANDTEKRVEVTLAILYEKLGEIQYPQKTVHLPFSITINDIARASGASRETTSIILKKLCSLNKINYKQKTLIFNDKDYFNNIIDE